MPLIGQVADQIYRHPTRSCSASLVVHSYRCVAWFRPVIKNPNTPQPRFLLPVGLPQPCPPCRRHVYRVRRAGEGRKAFGWAVMPCGVSEFARGIERWAGGPVSLPRRARLPSLPRRARLCQPASSPACPSVGCAVLGCPQGRSGLGQAIARRLARARAADLQLRYPQQFPRAADWPPCSSFSVCSLPQQKNSRREARAEKP